MLQADDDDIGSAARLKAMTGAERARNYRARKALKRLKRQSKKSRAVVLRDAMQPVTCDASEPVTVAVTNAVTDRVTPRAKALQNDSPDSVTYVPSQHHVESILYRFGRFVVGLAIRWFLGPE